MTREQLAVKEDNWKYRRAMAFGSVILMQAMLFYLAVCGHGENTVQQTLASSLPLGIVGIIMSYIGGPIADDWLQFRNNRST